jgi:hypothetical protein
LRLSTTTSSLATLGNRTAVCDSTAPQLPSDLARDGATDSEPSMPEVALRDELPPPPRCFHDSDYSAWIGTRMMCVSSRRSY